MTNYVRRPIQGTPAYRCIDKRNRQVAAPADETAWDNVRWHVTERAWTRVGRQLWLYAKQETK